MQTWCESWQGLYGEKQAQTHPKQNCFYSQIDSRIGPFLTLDGVMFALKQQAHSLESSWSHRYCPKSRQRAQSGRFCNFRWCNFERSYNRMHWRWPLMPCYLWIRLLQLIIHQAAFENYLETSAESECSGIYVHVSCDISTLHLCCRSCITCPYFAKCHSRCWLLHKALKNCHFSIASIHPTWKTRDSLWTPRSDQEINCILRLKLPLFRLAIVTESCMSDYDLLLPFLYYSI